MWTSLQADINQAIDTNGQTVEAIATAVRVTKKEGERISGSTLAQQELELHLRRAVELDCHLRKFVLSIRNEVAVELEVNKG